MDGSLAKKYLVDYTKKTRPLLDNFLVDETIKAGVLGKLPDDMMEHLRVLSKGGKGIRGALVVLTYKTCGGKDIESIEKASLFAELVHTGLLIHDDFMDRDSFRRGQETTHIKFAKHGRKIGIELPCEHYGISISACLGDAVFYLSWKLLLSINVPKKILFRAYNLYSDYLVRVCLGQALDMTTSGVKNSQEKDILNVMWLKSGEYTCLMPMLMGATLAGENDQRKLEAIKNYAECLGWAFQIQDDLLGVFGNEDKMGKPVGSDLKEGKNTLLTLYSRNNGTEDQKRFINSLRGKEDISKSEVLRAQNIFKKCGAYKYVLDKGWEYVEKGKTVIPKFTKDKKLQDIYESFLVFMMERVK